LKKEGVLRETGQGLIVTEANQHKFGSNHELQNTNILLVRKFLRDLTEADSLTEVIRRSLAVYDYLWGERSKGGKILVRTVNEDGGVEERELVLL